MKATTLLTLLATGTTTTAAARLPQRATTRNTTPQPQHPPYRLLHTLPNATPGGNARLLALSAEESTQGGAILTLPSNSNSTSTSTRTPLLTTITGTFRIPPARIPTTGPTANNTASLYAASFWVGVDSTTPATTTTTTTGGTSSDCGGSLRAGVDIFWDGTLDGAQRPFAWYQGPGQWTGTGFYGEEFAAGEGDLVRFSLGLEGGEGGDMDGGAGEGQVVVVVENFGGNVTCVNDPGATPKQRVRRVLPAAGGGGAGGKGLCRREAAWVVEDFALDGRPGIPVPLADFGSVTFGAGVKLEDGSERDLAGAEVRDVKLAEQGGRLTSCEVVDGKKVKCARVVGDN